MAVNVSALRYLEWGPGLRPQDIFLAWVLIAATSAGVDILPMSLLKKGLGVSRPTEALQRVLGGTSPSTADSMRPRWSYPLSSATSSTRN